MVARTGSKSLGDGKQDRGYQTCDELSSKLWNGMSKLRNARRLVSSKITMLVDVTPSKPRRQNRQLGRSAGWKGPRHGTRSLTAFHLRSSAPTANDTSHPRPRKRERTKPHAKALCIRYNFRQQSISPAHSAAATAIPTAMTPAAARCVAADESVCVGAAPPSVPAAAPPGTSMPLPLLVADEIAAEVRVLRVEVLVSGVALLVTVEPPPKKSVVVLPEEPEPEEPEEPEDPEDPELPPEQPPPERQELPAGQYSGERQCSSFDCGGYSWHHSGNAVERCGIRVRRLLGSVMKSWHISSPKWRPRANVEIVEKSTHFRCCSKIRQRSDCSSRCPYRIVRSRCRTRRRKWHLRQSRWYRLTNRCCHRCCHRTSHRMNHRRSRFPCSHRQCTRFLQRNNLARNTHQQAYQSQESARCPCVYPLVLSLMQKGGKTHFRCCSNPRQHRDCSIHSSRIRRCPHRTAPRSRRRTASAAWAPKQ